MCHIYMKNMIEELRSIENGKKSMLVGIYDMQIWNVLMTKETILPIVKIIVTSELYV